MNDKTNPCPSCVETIADWTAAFSGGDAPMTAQMIRKKFLPKTPAQQLAEECPHGMTEEQAQWVLERYSDQTAEGLDAPTDTAPRYVFGPKLILPEDLSVLMDGAEYKLSAGHVYRFPFQHHVGPCTYRRAYRLNQSYPHDGGECPLADKSVRVDTVDEEGRKYCRNALNTPWALVTSFTPLDQGSGQ